VPRARHVTVAEAVLDQRIEDQRLQAQPAQAVPFGQFDGGFELSSCLAQQYCITACAALQGQNARGRDRRGLDAVNVDVRAEMQEIPQDHRRSSAGPGERGGPITQGQLHLRLGGIEQRRKPRHRPVLDESASLGQYRRGTVQFGPREV
jgi:hypothetical protein